jgi:hypothetical protein
VINVYTAGGENPPGSLTSTAEHPREEAGQTAALHGAINIQIGQIWVDTAGNVKPTTTGNDISDSGNPQVPVNIPINPHP